MKKPYILVVEDEKAILELLQYNLEKEGFEVATAENGEIALDKIEDRIPDLLVSDWMMPKMDGITLTKELRGYENTRSLPIIMLTARGEEADKLKGFDLGLDDYLTKPFSNKELIARIKSILKRTKPSLIGAAVGYGGVEIDNTKREVFLHGKKMELTPTEFELMNFFVTKPERVHTRDGLLRNVWKNYDEIESRTVDVCIRRLRGIMQTIKPGSENMIKTVRGEGYMFDKSE